MGPNYFAIWVAKTFMITVCYVANSMKQNFEQENTTFLEFLIKVVGVTISNLMSQDKDEQDTMFYSATLININNSGSNYTE